jgi:tetratricopeptide (TPR) repeat protein
MSFEEDIKTVIKLLAWWPYNIKMFNYANFFDINTVAEGLAEKLLNEIYWLELVNLNKLKKNYPSVDLGDHVNKIGFQITSRKDKRKIIENLETFAKGPYRSFTNGIRFLLLTQDKKPEFKEKEYGDKYPWFKPNEHIMTVDDLIDEIEKIYHIDKDRFYRIKNILEEEFGKERRTGKEKTRLLTKLPQRDIQLIGREKYLHLLEDRVKKTDRVLLMNGLGGIGKTEVCKRFFMDHYNEFSVAGWFDYVSSVKETMVGGMLTSVFPTSSKETLDDQFQKVVDLLINLEGKVLLMIDNIEDVRDVGLGALKSLPVNIKVLVNSRLKLEGFEVHTLDFLEARDCRELFYSYCKCERDDDATVDKIVELCGRHTLTVELLARTAQNAAMAVKSLYEHLEREGFNLNEVIKDKVHTFWHNQEDRQRFFDQLLTIFDLSGLDDKELHILANVSVLPPVYFPVKCLREWLKLEDNEVINRLVRKGWLCMERYNILMHQVIQNVIRYKTKPGVEKCMQIIQSLAKKLNLAPTENPLEKKEFIIFAASTLDHIDEDDQELATLSNNLSIIYKEQGQPKQALEFQKKAVKIRETILDKNHPSLATSYNNLSMIYQDMGQLGKALEFQKKDIEISEKILDKNHPSLATSYNNLSLIYQDLGQLEQALKFQLKAINIREVVLDENHSDLALSYSNLSTIYQDLEQLEKALEFQLKATKIYESVLDKNHPSLATSYNNLSLIYKDLGQLEKALEFQKKDVEISEKILDKNHPSLATSYNNLSLIYKDLGQLEQALELQKKNINILQVLYPNGHARLGKAKNNLNAIIMKLAFS